MIEIVSEPQIRAAIDIEEAVAEIEDGFKAWSSGRAVVPPVGYLGFDSPPGDCHIKYGYIRGDDEFVIKVATGFYDNPARGLSSSNGFMVALSAQTGEPTVLLDDGGYLTDLRTAIAGLIAAKYLAPRRPKCIGIVGTGIQARMQLELLTGHYGSGPVRVWGRDRRKAAAFVENMTTAGTNTAVADTLAELCSQCDLIVTTTPSTAPLLAAEWIRAGTHITAVGADAKGKQELDPTLFERADICAVDSAAQCIDHGETAHAITAGLIEPAKLVELGAIIEGTKAGRSAREQITIADLTGLVVQDIRIAQHVLRRLGRATQQRRA
jgi:ornithine cyclodeaminase